MQREYNLINVISILYSWRKPLLGVLAAVGLITIAILLIMPNYYSSKTVFYAASEDLFKPQKVFGGSNTEIYFYGTSEDINRILTIGTSNRFLDTLVEMFNLYEVYDIDTSDSQAQYKVRKEFFKHYNILRTKYDAIEVTIEDTDPGRAASMANAAREQIAMLASGMIKESQKKLIKSYTHSIREKESMLKTLGDSLAGFQFASGVYDPEAQAEYLSTKAVELETKQSHTQARLDAYKVARGMSQKAKQDSVAILQAELKGIEAVLGILNNPTGENKINLKRFSEARGVVSAMEDAYQKATNQLSIDKEQLKRYQAIYQMDVPAIHLLSAAEVPVKKSKPRRTLILLTVLLVTTVFSTISVLLIESSRHFDWGSIGKKGMKAPTEKPSS